MWATDLPQCEGSDGVWGATITILCLFPIYKLANNRAGEKGEVGVSVASVRLQG